MYLQDNLSDNAKVSFTQETINKSSRMIQLVYDDGTIELFCSSVKARDLANALLESINKFEDKWGK